MKPGKPGRFRPPSTRLESIKAELASIGHTLRRDTESGYFIIRRVDDGRDPTRARAFKDFVYFGSATVGEWPTPPGDSETGIEWVQTEVSGYWVAFQRIERGGAS